MSFLPGATKRLKKLFKGIVKAGDKALPILSAVGLGNVTRSLLSATSLIQTAKGVFNLSATKSAGNYEKKSAREIYVHRLKVLAMQDDLQAREAFLIDEDYQCFRDLYKPFETLYLAEVDRLFNRPLEVNYNKTAKTLVKLTTSEFNNQENDKHQLVKVYDNYKTYLQDKITSHELTKALAITAGVSIGYIYANYQKENSDSIDLSVIDDVVTLGIHIKSGVNTTYSNQVGMFNADVSESLNRIGTANSAVQGGKSGAISGLIDVVGGTIGAPQGLSSILKGIL